MNGKVLTYPFSGDRRVGWYAGLYPVIRKFLFRLDPELVHGLTLASMWMAGAIPPARVLMRRAFQPTRVNCPVQAFGLTFSNAVGLAAGYDKNAVGWRGLATLGFGHIEVGTVTPRSQPGNSRPRVFRLPEDDAVVNRMGFPNRGADFVARRLRGRRPPGLVLGVNIGKNKTTPLEEAEQDYVGLVNRFMSLADYMAVNVSSPNTAGLRSLQARGVLDGLLRPVKQARDQKAREIGRRVPILVKLAPDLRPAELDGALDAILGNDMDGVIISNTSVARYNLVSPQRDQIGGLSGAPVKRLTTHMVHDVVRRTNGRLPVVASGGIMRPEDVEEKLDAGACLVQIYTGMIYRGPALVKRICESLP